MKKFTISLFLVLLILVFFPKSASADIVNPEYFSKTCSSDEIEVKCGYMSEGFSGSKTYNECAEYENNPNYRFLVSNGQHFNLFIQKVLHKNFFTGDQKYCLKATSTNDLISYHVKALLPLLLITLLLEIPIFLVFVSKGRKALFTVLSANLISVFLLYLTTIFIPFSGFTILIVLELIVIIFEAVFIKLMLKEISFRKIIIYSFIANALSAILGSSVFYYIKLIILLYHSMYY